MPLLAVSTTLPPWQKVVGPPADAVAPGMLVMVSVTGVRVTLLQDEAFSTLSA